jgi:hypothetical protein
MLLVPVFIGFFSLFLLRPLTVLMKQTRQAGHAVKQSILLRCLWNEWQMGRKIKSRSHFGLLKQGTLTEGEGSVQMTSSLRYLVL